jgi:hypothetical protein
MKSCRNRCICAAIIFTLCCGCSAQKPEKRLLGSWLGAPSVGESVSQGVDAVSQGKEVNPLVRGAAKFLGQKIAEATMSVELDFRSGGQVFFRGNTEVLGLPPDSDGTWEVTSASPDQLEISFGTEAKQIQGKVLFRNKDEFTLKLLAPTPDQAKNESKDAPKSLAAPASIVFRRNVK